MSNPSDTVLQPTPICPHCGHADNAALIDFDGAPDGRPEIACENCAQPYKVTRVLLIRYTGAKLEGGQP